MSGHIFIVYTLFRPLKYVFYYILQYDSLGGARGCCCHAGLTRREWRAVFHLTSTDEIPKHSRCPEGVDSWCFYKKALAEKRPPPSHKNMKIKLDLSESELKLVLGVYIDLTQPTLLSRCLKGRTQNKNESFHSKLWKRCLKTKFHGAQTTMFAFHMTVLEHNKGYIESSLLHEIFGGISESGTEVKLEKKRLQKSMEISLPRRKRSKISKDEKVEGYGGGKF